MRTVLMGIAAGIAVAVACSFVLLGAHWTSDVIGGLLLGLPTVKGPAKPSGGLHVTAVYPKRRFCENGGVAARGVYEVMVEATARGVVPPSLDPSTSDDFFSARPGGVAASIGRSLRARRPAFVAVAVWAVAFLLLGAMIIGSGLLLTHVLVPDGLDRMETGWSRWFVRERTPTLNSVTRIGSDLGSTGVILGIAAVAVVVLAIARCWRQIAFLVCALTLEFGLFLITTLIVDRHRPPVPELDAAPPTASYPSGHTATSLTLYVGLAIVVWSLVRGGLVRKFVWLLAVLLPVLVGVSRVYRGMHFPTDVTAGALLAIGALLFALLAVRSMSAAWDELARGAPPATQAVSQTEVRP